MPTDVILIFAFLVFLAIGGIAITYVYNQFFAQVQITPAFNSSTAVMDAFDSGNKVNAMWDYLILFILIGSALSMIIMGYFIDTQSIFMPVYIIGLIVAVILSIIFQNVWTSFAHSATFETLVLSQFKICDLIFSNLAIYVTLIGAISMIATYAKNREGQQ